jgi:hypothetical protein
MQSQFDQTFVEAFNRLGDQVMRVVPAVLVVTIILIVGGALAFLVRLAVYRMLRAVSFDRIAAGGRWGESIVSTGVFRSPADFFARVVQGLLWLFIILFAMNVVNPAITDQLVARLVNYIPDLATAVLVLLLGSAVSKFLARSALLAAVNAQWPAARLVAGGVRLLVMSLAVVVALEQLRIGRTALLVAFAILFAGVVVAGAIAFGYGARDLARNWLQNQMHPREHEDQEVLRHL